jgi:2-polyprenyl-3-methyl-5-hydroxy-6-metoxy-1,4-benzoquinol methylase
MIKFANINHRASHLSELMDDAQAPLLYLHNTYRDFFYLNRLVSQWRRIYKHKITPLLRRDPNKSFRLLDVGCGGGDIAYYLLKWSQADGFNLQITAIDLDERAIQWAEQQQRKQRHRHHQKQQEQRHQQIEFRVASTRKLLDEKKHFDLVISNHVLHHLRDQEVPVFLEECQQLGSTVICNDLERHPISYLIYSACFPLRFRKSFIYEDGRMSILKSFTRKELEELSPKNWRIKRLFPFRLLAIFQGKYAQKQSLDSYAREVSV